MTHRPRKTLARLKHHPFSNHPGHFLFSLAKCYCFYKRIFNTPDSQAHRVWPTSVAQSVIWERTARPPGGFACNNFEYPNGSSMSWRLMSGIILHSFCSTCASSSQRFLHLWFFGSGLRFGLETQDRHALSARWQIGLLSPTYIWRDS